MLSFFPLAMYAGWKMVAIILATETHSTIRRPAQLSNQVTRRGHHSMYRFLSDPLSPLCASAANIDCWHDMIIHVTDPSCVWVLRERRYRGRGTSRIRTNTTSE